MKRSNKDKKTKEQKVARQIYREERELTEQEIRRKEIARQKMINRLKAQREAEENTRPIKRIDKGKETLDKASDVRKSINTVSRLSAEGRGWVNIGKQFGLF